MISPGYAIAMAHYNLTMNERLYAVVADLAPEERRAACGAFFGSIEGTLHHLLWGDTAWLARFKGTAAPPPHPRTEMAPTFEALWQARRQKDSEILSWAEELEESWLREPFRFHSVVYRKDRVLPRWLLVMQLFNHQTHHRGQLTTLLSQRGLDYGITDLPMMPFADALEAQLRAAEAPAAPGTR